MMFCLDCAQVCQAQQCDCGSAALWPLNRWLDRKPPQWPKEPQRMICA
jgi:hypothetical protein